MALTLITQSEADTERLGALLGSHLLPGDTVALVGELGAGKTCLTRGLARGLGIAEPVTSPTFILVAEYVTRKGFPLYHADCYRLGAAELEAQDIGLEEMMDGRGVCVVEWAERILPLLPPDHLRVTLTPIDDDSRQLTFEPTGPRAGQLLAALQP